MALDSLVHMGIGYVILVFVFIKKWRYPLADLYNKYGLLRLKSKTARSAIIQKLTTEFNLTPIIAGAFYQQFAHY